MASVAWPRKLQSIASLHLDPKNPRLGRESTARAPREIIQYLFDHDKAYEVAESIARRGFAPNEPLLVVKEGDKYIVVEGNRRLAALKALKEPGLLEGQFQKKIERLAKKISEPSDLQKVPTVTAPTRRATDQQLAGRHVGTPVMAWAAENRASFILDKLEEGYTDAELQDRLNFSPADIQSARQTRAIAQMARALDLPDEIQAKLQGPKSRVFSTLERIFDSSEGRKHLMVEPDANYGIRGTTTKKAFLPGFTKLVSDLVLKQKTLNSRSLSTNSQIRDYFEALAPEHRVKKRRGKFIPSDIIKGKKAADLPPEPRPEPPPRPAKGICKYVLPKTLKVRYGSDRLKDLRDELVKMPRESYPNAGAVLMRVFLELSILHYLERIGELKTIVDRIEMKEGQRLKFGVPTLKQLVPEITKIAKKKLNRADALKVEKAIRYDSAAPFTITELHGFVHSTDIPDARGTWIFWTRTEPLFRLMLEQNHQELKS